MLNSKATIPYVSNVKQCDLATVQAYILRDNEKSYKAEREMHTYEKSRCAMAILGTIHYKFCYDEHSEITKQAGKVEHHWNELTED